MAVWCRMFAIEHGCMVPYVCQQTWLYGAVCLPSNMAVWCCMFASEHGCMVPYVCQRTWLYGAVCLPANMAVWCCMFASLNFADDVFRNLQNSVMNSLGYIIHVFSGQATHVDTTTLQQIDVVLLCEMFYLPS